MSCTGCGNSFGLLRKEVGCTECGFAFCSRCCSKRSFTKKEAVVKDIICNKCFNNLESGNKPATYSPPLAHKKRMAALGRRSQSVSSDGCSSSWIDERDKQIANRLQKLKEKCIPSQKELEQRLAKLKGMNPQKYTAPPITVYRPPVSKSSVEQASDLMKQIQEEVQLEEGASNELIARLANLKGEPVGEKSVSSSVPIQEVDKSEEPMDIESESKKMENEFKLLMRGAVKEIKELENDEEYKKILQNIKTKPKEGGDEESDEEETSRVLEQLALDDLADPENLDEVQMDSSESGNGKGATDEGSEELPWCTICTDDAKIRCFGCDGDLFCINCFKECHDSFDIKDHKTCPYLPPQA